MASYSIEDVELIRKRSSLSYQEAVALLDYHDGNVARALIDLERSGKLKTEGEENTTRPAGANSGESFGRKILNVLQKLYRFRIKVSKHETPVVNLSLAFCILAVVLSPRLAIIGVILSLILGYRFAFDRKDPTFAGVNLEKTVKSAAQNAKASVDDVVRSFHTEKEKTEARTEEKTEEKREDPKPERSSYFTPNPAAARPAYSARPADVPTIQVPVRTETSEGNVVIEDEGDGYHSATIG